MECKDNVIEWLTGDKTAKVTFTQQKYINRIERMAEKHGNSVRILHKNIDGSIYAEIPLSAVHLTIYGTNTGSFARTNGEEQMP